jgi:formate hydrogenlyase regulatory protein HycA
MAAPEKLRIPLDGDRFENVGRLPDGTQFMAFVTGAFPSGTPYLAKVDDWRNKKRWLAVIHRFDADGNPIGSESRLGGFDSEGRQAAGDKAFAHLENMYAELTAQGAPEFCDIRVKPFSLELDGVTHGLLYEQSEEEPLPGKERTEWVVLQPREIMFHPPWDSGEYST